MYVMQLTHIINIESNTKIDSHDNTNLNLKRKNLISEEFAVEKKEEKKISTEAKNQLKNTDQIKNKPQNNDTSKNFENRIQISSFQDLIELANKEKFKLVINYQVDMETKVLYQKFFQLKICLIWKMELLWIFCFHL